MMTQWVALLPSSKQPFRRAVRDGNGQITSVLRFEPDAPLELDEAGCKAVEKEIGRVLCLVDPADPNQVSPTRFVVDWEATDEVCFRVHGTKVPRQAASIQSGAGVREPAVAEKNDGGGSEGDDPEDVIELDDDLVDLLEKHQGVLPNPVTLESLSQWIGDGNQLTTLDGFTVDSVNRLHKALGIPVVDEQVSTEPNANASDKSMLIAAGLSQELADALGKNVESHPWVMDPESIKSKVKEGFDLTSLSDIGAGRSKQIKIALKIAE